MRYHIHAKGTCLSRCSRPLAERRVALLAMRPAARTPSRTRVAVTADARVGRVAREGGRDAAGHGGGGGGRSLGEWPGVIPDEK